MAKATEIEKVCEWCKQPFIAQKLTKREIVSEVSNELKIINHGFDTKKSFRHR